MITQREIEQRSAPKAGEVWEFSNGVTATIAEVDDLSGGAAPEIAYTDIGNYLTGFKFNATTDPMPVRRN